MSAPRSTDDSSPMLAQYRQAKAEHPDCLLFFHLGDFYELFFDDAIVAAPILDLTLTRRGKQGGDDIPMCGVPVHAVETYLHRLIKAGQRVAICEQMEDASEAKKRSGKPLVRREIVRVVTPGTLTEDSLLDARRHNYLAALAEAQGEFALARLDMSTGEFAIETVTQERLDAVLARVAPGEIVLPERMAARPEMAAALAGFERALTRLPAARFDAENGRKRLETLFGVRTLDGFGAFGRAAHAAGGALIDYVTLTQKGRLPRILPPRAQAVGAVMEIDPATRRGLEITQGAEGGLSLLAAIDRTLTPGGARLLAERIASPLTDVARINRRLDAVAFLVEDAARREGLRAALTRLPDPARTLGRLMVGRGGPRDLASLRDSLDRVPALRAALSADDRVEFLPPALRAARAKLADHAALVQRLAETLGPDLPVDAGDGGFVAAGVSAELDQLRALGDDSRKVIIGLQTRYAELARVGTLKIRHNNVLGYFVEVTAIHREKMETPGLPFVHRQTTANLMRYTTTELGELEARINGAAERALAFELELFRGLVRAIHGEADAIQTTARAIAAIDVAQGLAQIAAEARYARPVVDDSRDFAVLAGRHPTVEAALGAKGQGAFIANDCDLGERPLWLVTGPNMAGKSTFLRQNALIAVLAQAGSFVPATSARIGIVDRLFSRVGAADDLARGRSTFMVEMVETAAILNRAGERALVILDEIGRGTATFDGLSIAWAAVEYLHDVNRCRTLFATHYHELTSLAARLGRLACVSMRVKEWQGDIVFLHEVAKGAADRSYGIHVARLAGLPEAVSARAEEVLRRLEQGEQAGKAARLALDLPLFKAAGAIAPAKPSAVEAALAALNPDEMSPKDALEAIYRLRRMLPGS